MGHNEVLRPSETLGLYIKQGGAVAVPFRAGIVQAIFKALANQNHLDLILVRLTPTIIH